MIKIRTENVALACGDQLRLSVADAETEKRGGLVVLHEARGVTEPMRRVAGVLAGEGWLTAVPHLYHQDAGEPQPEERVRELSVDSLLADTDAALQWLSERGIAQDQQGVVGFGTGGTAAFLVAARRSVGAAVSVGGGIVDPLTGGWPPLVEIAGDLSCPWLGLYGEDEHPSQEVAKLQAAVEKAEMATDVVRYPGAGHRFDRDVRAAREAWQRLCNWFDLHLR